MTKRPKPSDVNAERPGIRRTKGRAAADILDKLDHSRIIRTGKKAPHLSLEPAGNVRSRRTAPHFRARQSGLRQTDHDFGLPVSPFRRACPLSENITPVWLPTRACPAASRAARHSRPTAVLLDTFESLLLRFQSNVQQIV